jgi:hypothetical protein
VIVQLHGQAVSAPAARQFNSVAGPGCCTLGDPFFEVFRQIGQGFFSPFTLDDHPTRVPRSTAVLPPPR